MRHTSEALAVWAVLCLAGCQEQQVVEAIVQPEAGAGKVYLAMYRPAEEMLRTGQIDAHRRIRMPDGVRIDTWVIRAAGPSPQTSPAGTVLLLHGLGQSKGPWHEAGEALARQGYDVVLLDLRAHGHSGGRYVTYGYREGRDARHVVDALLGEGLIHPPIYAAGVTLGASAALHYAAIDDRCRGVLAVAPYKDFRSVVLATVLRRAPLLSVDRILAIEAQAARRCGVPLHAASTLQAVRKVDCPVIFAHGLLDMSVPVHDVWTLYRAAENPKALRLRPPEPRLGDEQSWLVEQVRELTQMADDEALSGTAVLYQHAPPRP